MANCPSCGGFMKFDIDLQKLKCTACDGTISPYQGEGINAAEENTYETTVFTCPQCGGELFSTDHDLSGNCSFCGSPVVFESKLVREKRPDCIIPFGITKEECKEKYFEELKKNPFAPKELTDPDYVDGFRGIYVPYWLYYIKQDSPISVEGTRSESHGNYTYIYTDLITGQNETEYRHIMHDASSVLLDDISEKIEPFETVPNKDFHRRTPAFQKFSPGFFAGFYAEPADVPAHTYKNYSLNIANERTREYVKHHSVIGKYNIKLTDAQCGSQVSRTALAMMPVWFLSYRKNDRIAYAAVNGQTGRVISDTPIDFGKFALHFLITALIILAVMMFVTVLPVTVTLVSVIMGGIVTRYCHDDIRVLKGRTLDAVPGRLRQVFGSSSFTFGIFITMLVAMVILKVVCLVDNDAVTLCNSHVYSVPAFIFTVAHMIRMILIYKDLGKITEEKPMAYYLCPMFNFAASVFGTVVLVMSPVQDYKYYAAGLAVIAVELVSFVLIIKNYNRIATRPLPQFSIHKGGDDRA
ncbi:MAG: hypothetical protein MJ095_07540 [Oscillospiraceae bacterium]|nr:hypothetical protein [Oscillospiraceae bacterium]